MAIRIFKRVTWNTDTVEYHLVRLKIEIQLLLTAMVASLPRLSGSSPNQSKSRLYCALEPGNSPDPGSQPMGSRSMSGAESGILQGITIVIAARCWVNHPRSDAALDESPEIPFRLDF